MITTAFKRRFSGAERWLRAGLVLFMVFALAGATSHLAAQEGAAPDQGAAGEGVETLPGLEDIDQILEEGSEDLAGGGIAYDPGDRRDPFKSLLVSTDQPTFGGPRPEGIPGLLIDEIILSGIFRTRRGYLAQVQSADRQKSYLLHKGDQLFDGDVIEINATEVIFKQNVQDPTALKPFREVIKSLNP